ncbi:MAG: molybdenum cofactor guanylyltransferase [Desulfobacula sp.]|nr:molybdenum cofactor guanylyltransferase [Desulfobacula sp.]
MKFDCTGVILAGGKNSRLPGKKKTFHKIGNTMILETIHDIFERLFKEVIIVVNDPQEFADWDMNIVTDIIPAGCALAGLHAGLFYAKFEQAYVTACDAPFVNSRVIEYIVQHADTKYDVVLPRTKMGTETLSAVYSKACIPLIEKNLEKNIFMIKKFFRKKRVKEIPIEILRQWDPETRFIFNINTPEDLEKAEKMAR